MLLAIDARNRSVTAGFREGDAWLAVKRFGAAADKSADEYALLLEAAFAAALRTDATQTLAPRTDAPRSVAPVPGRLVTEAWISSVVPALTPRLVEAVASAFGLVARVIGPGVRTGVKLRTDFPQEVGSDLVCAAAAAYEKAGGACVVVDFGASLAFSAVNASCEFLGAAIAPGVETAAEALRESAAQIPEVRMDFPARVIGKNTVESVQAGILIGYGGLVSRIVGLMREELGGKEGAARVMVIGSGDPVGRSILASCGFDRFEPHLVLEGIALVAALA